MYIMLQLLHQFLWASLVTTFPMFKILGLNCLATAYVLNAMNLDGVKLDDVQAIISGVFTAASFPIYLTCTTLSYTRGCGAITRCRRVTILGGVLNPTASRLITSGMKTLHLHVQQQNSATEILEVHHEVKCIYYPSMPFICWRYRYRDGRLVNFINQGRIP